MDKEMMDDKIGLAQSHLKSCAVRHELFYFETEIEELILLNENLKRPKNIKPSEFLRMQNPLKKRYEKNLLPTFAEKMDLEKIK